MKKLHLDILALTIYSAGNAVYFVWPSTYIYHTSYFKHYSPSITVKQVFSSTLAIFAGIILGNFIFPKLFYLFNIKKTMLIGAILYLINNLTFFMIKGGIYSTYFNTLFAGITY